jgi:hypothetical protein
VNDTALLALALDPTRILTAQGLAADPWQRELLFSTARDILLNCSRGAGKSRVTSALALHTALTQPRSLVLLVSRSLRQATELFRYVKEGYRALGRPIDALKDNECQLELANRSRVVALPGREETIRSFQGVRLLILDEAARIPDELYSSVSPMTGVSGGRTVCLSTPFGQRGFFWREWHNEQVAWTRFRIPWQQCPRLTLAFIDNERRKFGDAWIRQEYECSFEAREGLVYPDFAQCLTDNPPAVPVGQRRVGGIDFGFRNPFAAVWGFVDANDVLHLVGEIYRSQTPLHVLAAALPRGVLWYADPAGRTEIEELRADGHKVLRGINSLRLGLQAVTARLRTGRLRVDARACPNLVREAKLYRYGDDPGEENPVDEHNHALAALRYLVSRLDAHRLARGEVVRLSGGSVVDPNHPATQPPNHLTTQPPDRPKRLDIHDPRLWTPL